MTVMLLRILAGLLMIGGLTFGAIGTTHANDNNYQYPPPRHDSAPELDPGAIGSGIVMLAGGVLLLNERRRKKQQ
jgi:hypothetical protein